MPTSAEQIAAALPPLLQLRVCRLTRVILLLQSSYAASRGFVQAQLQSREVLMAVLGKSEQAAIRILTMTCGHCKVPSSAPFDRG